jgi:bacterioferritin (cytochrome b1)
MDFDAILRDAPTRRAFMRMSGVTVVGGSAVFIAACGSSDDSTSSTSSASGTTAMSSDADVAILNSALDLEHTAIAAYTAGAPLLRGIALASAKRFLSQEQEHADGLSQAIKQLGGTPNAARSSYDFGRPKTQTDVLRLADMIENTAVAAYIDAIPKLQDPNLRATAAAIVTNEAEHIAILRGALGEQPVPAAFVTGKA